MKSKKVVCVIPARLGSTRLPRKMLADLNGKPLIQRTYEAASQCPQFDEVVVAVDSEELETVVKEFGGQAILTSPHCQSGTDRLAELALNEKLKGDVWVNWQGDEPFISKTVIDDLLQSCEGEGEQIWTLKSLITDSREISSPDVVKVVTDYKGWALYFSRSCIPYGTKENIYKHVGLYGFTLDALKKIATLKPCFFEQVEKLEQLRWLYNGLSIRAFETTEQIFGINTKEELALANQICYTS